MADALVVGLPQLLLDRALARIPRPRAAGRTSGPRISRRSAAEDTAATLTHGTARSREDRRTGGERGAKMIPDTEAVCQASEVTVDGGDAHHKIKDRPEREAASVTAWKRYQRLIVMMEARGGEFNRKSAIEAIFRGSDLVYASH